MLLLADLSHDRQALYEGHDLLVMTPMRAEESCCASGLSQETVAKSAVKVTVFSAPGQDK